MERKKPPLVPSRRDFPGRSDEQPLGLASAGASSSIRNRRPAEKHASSLFPSPSSKKMTPIAQRKSMAITCGQLQHGTTASSSSEFASHPPDCSSASTKKTSSSVGVLPATSRSRTRLFHRSKGSWTRHSANQATGALVDPDHHSASTLAAGGSPSIKSWKRLRSLRSNKKKRRATVEVAPGRNDKSSSEVRIVPSSKSPPGAIPPNSNHVERATTSLRASAPVFVPSGLTHGGYRPAVSHSLMGEENVPLLANQVLHPPFQPIHPNVVTSDFGYIAPGSSVPHVKDYLEVKPWHTTTVECGGKSQSRPLEVTAKKLSRRPTEKRSATAALPSLDTPRVFHSKEGLKITVIDESHKVFVIDLLSSKKCGLIHSLMNDHLDHLSKTGKASKGWRTLYTYTKMDLPVSEVPSLYVFADEIMDAVVRAVGEVFSDRRRASRLQRRSWKEPHLLLYQNVEGKTPHTGIPMHYDGCHITFSVMLSHLKDYDGGGTYFRCLKKTIKLRQGQVLVHPGALYHKGIDITSGYRLLMVGFLDGFDPQVMDGSRSSDYCEDFEKNVCYS